MSKTNENLRELYDTFYLKGEDQHYTTLIFKDVQDPEDTEVTRVMAAMTSWEGRAVLDVGCGTGLLVEEIAKLGASRVVGIDYSAEAIKYAKERPSSSAMSFECGDFQHHRGTYDVVASLGTLEHMDDPFAALEKMKSLLAEDGTIIITAPNWLNPRGYVLQTLRLLFDAPITLADLHYLAPNDFMRWAEQLDMSLSWSTFDQSWAQGEKLLKDFSRRLPNVLIRDMNGITDQSHIDALLHWIETYVCSLPETTKTGGALAIYKFEKRSRE